MERCDSRKPDSALAVCLAPSMVVFERWLGLTYQSLKSRPRFGKAGPDHALMLILFLGVLSSLLAVRVLLLLLVSALLRLLLMPRLILMGILLVLLIGLLAGVVLMGLLIHRLAPFSCEGRPL